MSASTEIFEVVQEKTPDEAFNEIISAIEEIQHGLAVEEEEALGQELSSQKPPGYADQGYRHG